MPNSGIQSTKKLVQSDSAFCWMLVLNAFDL
jgi:hypothetical protein